MEFGDIVDRAVECLRNGGVVALPTETVYGLGADATNPQAVRRIFEIKGRPANHPLIVHLHDLDQVSQWAVDVPKAALRLGQHFWPGPLTLILPRAGTVLDEVTAGQDTVGLRIPRHPLTLEILKRFGRGVAAPSANRFTRVSPTTAAHVRADLGNSVDLIVDGGPSDVGIESTIVDFSQTPAVVLRLGCLTLDQLQQVSGVELSRANQSGTVSPGQHRLHYSPQVKTRVVSTSELAPEAQRMAANGQRVVVISQNRPPDDLQASVTTNGALAWWQLPSDWNDVARVLYDWLHRVDEQAFDQLLVDLPADEGIAAAIRDRLSRAAGWDNNESRS